MPVVQHYAYSRWIDKWLPHLVYGPAVNGSPGAVEGAAVPRPMSVADLPGGEIVRAF
jgi:hypothetical protein